MVLCFLYRIDCLFEVFLEDVLDDTFLKAIDQAGNGESTDTCDRRLRKIKLYFLLIHPASEWLVGNQLSRCFYWGGEGKGSVYGFEGRLEPEAVAWSLRFEGSGIAGEVKDG